MACGFLCCDSGLQFFTDPDSVVARANKLRKRIGSAASVSGKGGGNRSNSSEVKDTVVLVSCDNTILEIMHITITDICV